MVIPQQVAGTGGTIVVGNLIKGNVVNGTAITIIDAVIVVPGIIAMLIVQRENVVMAVPMREMLQHHDTTGRRVHLQRNHHQRLNMTNYPIINCRR